MMALLDNGCEGKTAQMSASATLKPGKNELLVNSSNKDLRNANHQVDIRFADPSVKTLQATLWYMNGRHEDIKIENPKHPIQTGVSPLNCAPTKTGPRRTCWPWKCRAPKRVLPRRKSKRKFAHATYSQAAVRRLPHSGNEVTYAEVIDPHIAGPGDLRRFCECRRATASAPGLFRPGGSVQDRRLQGRLRRHAGAVHRLAAVSQQVRRLGQGPFHAERAIGKAFRDSTADITKLEKTPASA